MFTRPTTFRAAFTALLTVWMTAVSLGVWVRHAHAVEATPHVHGWGWCPAGCPTGHTSQFEESVQVHRHLVVCGVECPNEAPADGDTPTSPDGVSVIDHPCERPTPVGVSALIACDLFVPVQPSPESDSPTADRDRLIHRSIPLSAFACRLVSGVLRS